jgi:hypothetical protein
MSLNTGDQEYNSGKKYRQKGALCGPNIEIQLVGCLGPHRSLAFYCPCPPLFQLVEHYGQLLLCHFYGDNLCTCGSLYSPNTEWASVSAFVPHFNHSWLSKRWMSLRTISEKWRLISLLPLFFLKLLLVIPSLPKGRFFSLLLI